VTLTRVANNASCNWVNLVQVNSVQFVCSEQGFSGCCCALHIQYVAR